MQHPDPSTPEATEPGGDERPLPERAAAGHAQHVEDHHFELPTVAPVQRPVPAATSQW
jgi:hypothetical protein